MDTTTPPTVKASRSIQLIKDKDCKGSVCFKTKDNLAPLSSIYVNRTFVEIATAQNIRVTIEILS